MASTVPGAEAARERTDDRDGGGGEAMATHSSSNPTIARAAGTASMRRLLAVCCVLLAGFALLLGGASLIDGLMRQPLDRIPVATYAARRGIALPTTSIVPPGDREAPAPSAASPALQTSLTAEPQIVTEVATAYLSAWERWAEACLTLDAAPLVLAFAPPELDRARDYVLRLRASDRALRLAVAHRVTVLELDGDTALLLDDLDERSVYLDPATRQPLPDAAQPTPVGPVRVYCRLRRTETVWRVVELSWSR